MTIHHVGLSCSPSTFKAMRDFYVTILAPLGYTVLMEKEDSFLGMTNPHKAPEFWLFSRGDPNIKVVNPDNYSTKEFRDAQPVGTHLAFATENREEVDRWYDVALRAGGIDNGKPGPRPEYTETYYAAFVIDPLGNNVEAVHLPHSSKIVPLGEPA